MKRVLKKRLDEASVVDFNELDPKIQQQVFNVSKILKADVDVIFDGLHGVIAIYSYSQATRGMAYTFMPDILEKLLQQNIRWVNSNSEKGNISVAFKHR